MFRLETMSLNTPQLHPGLTTLNGWLGASTYVGGAHKNSHDVFIQPEVSISVTFMWPEVRTKQLLLSR